MGSGRIQSVIQGAEDEEDEKGCRRAGQDRAGGLGPEEGRGLGLAGGAALCIHHTASASSHTYTAANLDANFQIKLS